ncbi:MAG: hypothetical protein EXR54_05800 [Dehalococcoidia bacterium]|nr:hypothetical protein [Dehalococcoidia bacterium]MSQ17070.1 hypothetical protein [Dehalococcoidia bacterium]
MIAIPIVIALRLLAPITILRWPLGGGLLSMACDALDVVLVDSIGLLTGETGGFGSHYQIIDKTLDIYYMSFEAFVSLRWTNRLARNTSILLFAYRIVEMALFEVTGIRKLLFVFPNLFENFYVFYLIASKHFPKYAANNPKQLGIALFLLFIPKIGQEWMLHYQKVQPWNWLKQVLGG